MWRRVRGALSGMNVAALQNAVETADGIDHFQDLAKEALLKGETTFTRISGNIVIDDGRLRALADR